MILVSACLAGIDCAWDGKNRLDAGIKRLLDENLAIAICPELLGGRNIPRARTEIKGGNGEDVLNGKAKVFDEEGKDVTVEFLKGAYATLSIVKKYNIKKAVLKSKSPSCGVGKIYDGNFKGNLIAGDGVTGALLKREGLEVSCRDT
ncbi:MAG: DUF523 domain-containing protein [Candidatus Omnitrophica bacterium]|nr:DUF523 domain-containing protein [Candidatus Omnitrophota bacterium]